MASRCFSHYIILSHLSVLIDILPVRTSSLDVQNSLVLLQLHGHPIRTKNTDDDSCPKNNEVWNLIPHHGAWLGGVLKDALETWDDKFKWNGLLAPDLEVLRMYSFIDDIDPWTQPWALQQFVDQATRGKILWFDVTPTNWTLCATGGCDEKFQILSEVAHSIAPAKAFISLGHEIDHYWDYNSGSDADYVTLFRRAVDYMRKRGVTNIVWKYVVSDQIFDDDGTCWYNAMHRWPGDDYVDWLGMNVYMKYAKRLGNGKAKYVYGETYFDSNMGESVHHVLDSMTNKLTMASQKGRDFKSLPWALSTVGVHSPQYNVVYNDILGNENLGVPADFRIEFMKEFKEAMNNRTYQQFKMFSYYDDGDCELDGTIINAFHQFATSDVFNTAHTC